MALRLETARLVIRPFAPGDAEAWLALVRDPEVTRYVPVGPAVTDEMFVSVLEGRLRRERETGLSVWAVELARSGEFIGQCGLGPIEESEGPETELLYHYLPRFWGQGYGTEAAAAVVAHALGPLGLSRVVALAAEANVGSWRIMEHIGMRYVRTGTYFAMENVRKYEADASWWSPPDDGT